MSKYRNVKTTSHGIRFDSKREAARYNELLILERSGAIRGLDLQPSYEVCPAVKFDGDKRRTPARVYKADFAYWEGDKRVIEDVKGMRTAVFNLKRQLLKAHLGLEIKIVK